MRVPWAIRVKERVEVIRNARHMILAEKVVQLSQNRYEDVKSGTLIERDVLRMYPHHEVKVQAGILERIDHVVWHI